MDLDSLFWSIKMMTDLPCRGCSVTPTLARTRWPERFTESCSGVAVEQC